MLNSENKNYPNVIILVLDAVRSRNLSCYGYKRNTSPNLDEFARKNVLYQNAIATSSWTLPSVSSIFTGLMPSEHGILNINCRLNKHETIASSLKSIGYETIAISNVGWVTKYLGLNKGFDTFIEFDKYSLPKKKPQKILELAKSTLSIRDYGAEIANNEIIKWLSTRDNSRPYFLYVHYVEPHFPYNPPRPYHRKFGKIYPWTLFVNKDIKGKEFPDFYSGDWKISEKEWDIILRLYDGEIAFLDSKIGEILSIIQHHDDEQLIFVTADHGECLSDERNLPVLQHQFGLYDDLIKVPLLVKYPDARSKRVVNQVQLSDIFGTISDIIGIKYKNKLRNLLTKENNFEISEYALSEYIPPDNMLQRIKHPNVSEKYFQIRRSFRTNEEKYIHSNALKEYFNLKNDLLEFNNLFDTLPIKKRNEIQDTFNRVFKNILQKQNLNQKNKLLIDIPKTIGLKKSSLKT